MSTSINPQEIENFAKDSAHWWDEHGPFAPLHKLNPVRLQYICGQIRQHYDLEDAQKNSTLEPFRKLEILDIGCGGGLVCEPLARLGAKVTGVDADEKAIAVATHHAAQSDLAIEYVCGAAEDQQKQYDVVLALEVLEHVNDIDVFVKSCADLCKPGGLIIFSTLNRTVKSFALGIFAAEYLLRWVPQGTHHWKKFVKPSELARAVRSGQGREKDVTGLIFNPVAGDFKLSDDQVAVNYFMSAERL